MIQQILQELKNKKYKIFENGAVNIVGIRKKPYKLNQFNDELHCFFSFQDGFAGKAFQITTLPGKYWLTNLMNPKGAAILMPGQYLESYRIGLHKKKKALIQVRPVIVYRDKNGDEEFDLINPDAGNFGINIHRAGAFSHFVNSWSAGCQVFKKEHEFLEFINICEQRTFFNNGLFTYTLLED